MNILRFSLLVINFFLFQTNYGNIKKSNFFVFNSERSDTVINSVKKSFVGKKLNADARNKMISLYLIALNRPYEKPELSDVYSKDYRSLFHVYKYKRISIQNKLFNTYYINIDFEDGTYEAILALSDNDKKPYNLLLLYEKLDSATNYSCTSSITNNLIFVNRVSEDYKSNSHYIVKLGNFLDYFKVSDKVINVEWGNKEGFLSKNKDSIYTYQYKMKGRVKNHLKDGYWDERKYSLDKKKSVNQKNNYLDGIIVSIKK